MKLSTVPDSAESSWALSGTVASDGRSAYIFDLSGPINEYTWDCVLKLPPPARRQEHNARVTAKKHFISRITNITEIILNIPESKIKDDIMEYRLFIAGVFLPAKILWF